MEPCYHLKPRDMLEDAVSAIRRHSSMQLKGRQQFLAKMYWLLIPFGRLPRLDGEDNDEKAVKRLVELSDDGVPQGLNLCVGAVQLKRVRREHEAQRDAADK